MTKEKVETTKIEVVCSECGKKFKTTQEWFDKRNKDGKLRCRKCRLSKWPSTKEKPKVEGASIDNSGKVEETKKIEVVCSDCGKKFKTTQEWFDKRNKDGKLPCRKCRLS